MDDSWGFNAFEFDDFEMNTDDSLMVWTTPIGEGIRPGYQGSHIRKDTKTTQLEVSVFRAWCDAHSFKNSTENMAIEMLADLHAAQIHNENLSPG